MGWNYLSILKIQRCRRHSLWMDKWSNHTTWFFTQVGIKGSITVGWELRQQNPSDLLSGAGTSRGHRDYNIAKQLCIKRICLRMLSKSPPNWATSHTYLHCDVTYPTLTAAVLVLHIPSWREGVRKNVISETEIKGGSVKTKGLLQFLKQYPVRCHYNTINFSQILTEHNIAHQWWCNPAIRDN